MSRSNSARTRNRLTAIAVVVLISIIANIAISYASGVVTLPPDIRPHSGVVTLPPDIRPHSGVVTLPPDIRPHSGVVTLPPDIRP
jgi:hypothetical protein